MSNEKIQELKEQAQELIDLGDSREKAEGHGMMRVIEEIIKSKPTEREIMIERASHYLSDGDLSTEEMCDAIANHEDQYDLIDNVEGVVVWEKVEYSFSCDDFLQEIGYVEK